MVKEYDYIVIGGGSGGIAGAMTASFVGKFVRILGIRMFNYIGCSIMILSWLDRKSVV